MQLPIYPTKESEAPVTLIEAPSQLVPYIAQAREATTEAFSGVGSYVETGVSKWIGFERRVESASGRHQEWRTFADPV